MSTITCVKVELEGSDSYLVDRIEGDYWLTLVKQSEPGDVYRLAIIEVDERILKDMPEFDGF